jgi:hypothetical protein
MWSGETVIQTGAVGATTASSGIAASTGNAAAAAAAFNAVQAVAAAAGVVAARHQQLAALIQDAAAVPKDRRKYRHLSGKLCLCTLVTALILRFVSIESSRAVGLCASYVRSGSCTSCSMRAAMMTHASQYSF